MISHLLNLGASPNVYDKLGRTPSMRAADYGHIQVLKLLAEAHADLTGNNSATMKIRPNEIYDLC